MVDAMLGNVPAWFIDVVNWDTLAEVVLDHFIHKGDVLLFVIVVSFHLPLQVFETLLDHREVAFQSND